MKEHLDTIPVTEAFDKQSECAFCDLYEKANRDTVRYLLGASYMEEDVRAETDRVGFCREHYHQLYHGQNLLGVALMTSTHMARLEKELRKLTEAENLFPKKGVFAKKTQLPVLEALDASLERCFACERIEKRMNNYMETFFHLWKNEGEFRKKVLEGKGFCLFHFRDLLQYAPKCLSGSAYQSFVKELSALVLDNFKRVREDVLWLIDKYDYRFKDEPWKNAKDSVPRAILKLSACDVEPDRKKDE